MKKLTLSLLLADLFYGHSVRANGHNRHSPSRQRQFSF